MMYYNVENPVDIRKLDLQVEAWIESGNPKAKHWLPAPEKPTSDAIWNGTEWIIPGVIQTAEQFRQWLSNQRWQKETGGITVGGQPISTHRDEAAHWLARYSDATRWLMEDATARAINPDGIYPYKPKHGEPVYLSATQVVRAYLCQAWFVNACFAVEKAAADAVKGGADIGDVVASIQWPQTSFDWEPS